MKFGCLFFDEVGVDLIPSTFEMKPFEKGASRVSFLPTFATVVLALVVLLEETPALDTPIVEIVGSNTITDLAITIHPLLLLQLSHHFLHWPLFLSTHNQVSFSQYFFFQRRLKDKLLQPSISLVQQLVES